MMENKQLAARKAILASKPKDVQQAVLLDASKIISPYLEITQEVILEGTFFLKDNEYLNKSCLKSIDESLMACVVWRLTSFESIDNIIQMITDTIDEYEKEAATEEVENYEKLIFESAETDLNKTLYYLDKIQWVLRKKLDKYKLFDKTPNEIETYMDSFINGIALHLEKSNKYQKINKTGNNAINKDEIDLSFEDLFENPYKDKDTIDSIIEILRDVTPPLISPQNKWIGSKGAMKIFIEKLRDKGIIKLSLTKKYAGIINQSFPKIGIYFLDAGGFNKNASETYGKDFDDRIERIIQSSK